MIDLYYIHTPNLGVQVMGEFVIYSRQVPYFHASAIAISYYDRPSRRPRSLAASHSIRLFACMRNVDGGMNAGNKSKPKYLYFSLLLCRIQKSS